MRRPRKIKRLKFSKLLKARIIKLNYTLSSRTLRKQTNKKRISNIGLFKVGGNLTSYFLKFLKPSILFSYIHINKIMVSMFPNLILPKSTDSTPKYNLDTPLLLSVSDSFLKKVIPLKSATLSLGLEFLLFSNSISDILSKGNVDIKNLTYAYNYVLTLAMLKAYNCNSFKIFYQKLYFSKLAKSKQLLLVCFKY